MIFSSPMKELSKGFNLLAINLEIILYTTLQQEMGLKSPNETAFCTFEMRRRKVEFKAL